MFDELDKMSPEEKQAFIARRRSGYNIDDNGVARHKFGPKPSEVNKDIKLKPSNSKNIPKNSEDIGLLYNTQTDEEFFLLSEPLIQSLDEPKKSYADELLKNYKILNKYDLAPNVRKELKTLLIDITSTDKYDDNEDELIRDIEEKKRETNNFGINSTLYEEALRVIDIETLPIEGVTNQSAKKLYRSKLADIYKKVRNLLDKAKKIESIPSISRNEDQRLTLDIIYDFLNDALYINSSDKPVANGAYFSLFNDKEGIYANLIKTIKDVSTDMDISTSDAVRTDIIKNTTQSDVYVSEMMTAINSIKLILTEFASITKSQIEKTVNFLKSDIDKDSFLLDLSTASDFIKEVKDIVDNIERVDRKETSKKIQKLMKDYGIIDPQEKEKDEKTRTISDTRSSNDEEELTEALQPEIIVNAEGRHPIKFEVIGDRSKIKMTDTVTNATKEVPVIAAIRFLKNLGGKEKELEGIMTNKELRDSDPNYDRIEDASDPYDTEEPANPTKKQKQAALDRARREEGERIESRKISDNRFQKKLFFLRDMVVTLISGMLIRRIKNIDKGGTKISNDWTPIFRMSDEIKEKIKMSKLIKSLSYDSIIKMHDDANEEESESGEDNLNADLVTLINGKYWEKVENKIKEDLEKNPKSAKFKLDQLKELVDMYKDASDENSIVTTTQDEITPAKKPTKNPDEIPLLKKYEGMTLEVLGSIEEPKFKKDMAEIKELGNGNPEVKKRLKNLEASYTSAQYAKFSGALKDDDLDDFNSGDMESLGDTGDTYDSALSLRLEENVKYLSYKDKLAHLFESVESKKIAKKKSS